MKVGLKFKVKVDIFFQLEVKVGLKLKFEVAIFSLEVEVGLKFTTSLVVHMRCVVFLGFCGHRNVPYFHDQTCMKFGFRFRL